MIRYEIKLGNTKIWRDTEAEARDWVAKSLACGHPAKYVGKRVVSFNENGDSRYSDKKRRKSRTRTT